MKHVPSRGGLAAVLSLSAAALSRGVVAQRPNNAPARAPRIRADFAVADGVTWVDVLANDDAARGGGELRVTEILRNNNDDDDDDNNDRGGRGRGKGGRDLRDSRRGEPNVELENDMEDALNELEEEGLVRGEMDDADFGSDFRG
eukprot:CAMPEP_0172529692 /NCGR_PEP_ID=MMETSP1067-20121228/3710_1 /TAXON_ID=265564 ORGANISM="Thalassiosira punctigera, Strain Tpunct2005C2" /NCGR_SAMPLE_ID=MMETSP1067 /ASSEMBLY_ACC=CAM_ASM_000444 /LENGTH=144 /DNA_ID=CAMNT_0013313791 /DNA_START=172 /DNA_END=602 /DNA_ORIENTATION=-